MEKLPIVRDHMDTDVCSVRPETEILDADDEVGEGARGRAGEELERLLLNLVENAVKYNRPGGEVEVRLGLEDEAVVIEDLDQFCFFNGTN